MPQLRAANDVEPRKKNRKSTEEIYDRVENFLQTHGSRRLPRMKT